MSTFDPVGGDGLGGLFLGAGTFSDQGMDLDAHFALPPGTLGFDESFQRIPGREIDEARDEGQFGVALFGRWLDGPAPKVSVHYMRYHARIPVVSSRTGDAAAIAATTDDAVNATALGLVDDYLRTGLDPTAAVREARATAESLAVSDYGNAAGLRVEYPEDIDAIGATLSLTSLRRGTLFAAEFTRHFGVPFQYAVEPLVAATLSPIEFDAAIGGGPLGEFGPDTRIRGYRRGDRTQGAASLTRLLVKRLGADQVLTGVNVGWVHLHEAPSRGEVAYEPSGHSDDAWGAQIFASLRYNGVVGSLNVTPRIAYSRDLDGTTPAPTATFVEGRAGLALGVTVDRLQRVEADLGYVQFSGAGRRNLLRDRDYVQLRLAVSL
jgi:hypothetical protein